MKTHDTFLELAAAALDYPLTPAERTRLDGHLAACQACVRSASAMRADALVLAEMPMIILPDRRGSEILAAALHPPIVRHPVRLIAIVALLGLLLVGSLVAGAEILRQNDEDLSVVPPVPSLVPSPGVLPSTGPSGTPDPSAPRGTLAVSVLEGGTQWVELASMGGAVTRLAEGRDPAWLSADRIVYTCWSQPGGPLDVCAVNADGSGQPQVLLADADRPAPAPDGRTIAVHRGMTDVGETWLMAADGSNPRLLHAGDFSRWSPDGAWLAGQPESAVSEIAIVGADGDGFKILGPGKASDWRPGGTWITFVLVGGSGYSIGSVNVATGESETLVESPTGSELGGPVWLQDGRLLYVRDLKLMGFDPAKSGGFQLTTGSVSPGGSVGDALAVSPDGGWVAYTNPGEGDGTVEIASIDGGRWLTFPWSGPATQPRWAPAGASAPDEPGSTAATLGDSWADAAVPVVTDRPVGQIEAVTARGTGFVAVGRGCTGDTPTCEGVVWTSMDGSTWERVPASDALDTGSLIQTSGPEVGMFDVTAGTPGIVAIGYAARPDMRATVWFSPDGVAWERITLGPTARVGAVTWDGTSFVLVGEDRVDAPTSLADFATAKARAAVWTSPDGRTWARVAHTPALETGAFIDTMEDPASGGMADVAAGPVGLVAVGSTCRPLPAGCEPAAWISPDGMTWVRADGMPKISGSLSSVAPVPAPGSGFVAVGAQTCGSSPDAVPGGCPAVALFSADGRTWSQQPFDQAGELTAVVPMGGRLFASASGGPETAWTSADGTSWTPANVAGGSATGADRSIGEWHCAANGTAPGIAVCIATGSATNESAAWVSRGDSGR